MFFLICSNKISVDTGKKFILIGGLSFFCLFIILCYLIPNIITQKNNNNKVFFKNNNLVLLINPYYLSLLLSSIYLFLCLFFMISHPLFDIKNTKDINDRIGENKIYIKWLEEKKLSISNNIKNYNKIFPFEKLDYLKNEYELLKKKLTKLYIKSNILEDLSKYLQHPILGEGASNLSKKFKEIFEETFSFQLSMKNRLLKLENESFKEEDFNNNLEFLTTSLMTRKEKMENLEEVINNINTEYGVLNYKSQDIIIKSLSFINNSNSLNYSLPKKILKYNEKPDFFFDNSIDLKSFPHKIDEFLNKNLILKSKKEGDGINQEQIFELKQNNQIIGLRMTLYQDNQTKLFLFLIKIDNSYYYFISDEDGQIIIIINNTGKVVMKNTFYVKSCFEDKTMISNQIGYVGFFDTCSSNYYSFYNQQTSSFFNFDKVKFKPNNFNNREFLITKKRSMNGNFYLFYRHNKYFNIKIFLKDGLFNFSFDNIENKLNNIEKLESNLRNSIKYKIKKADKEILLTNNNIQTNIV